MTDQPTAQRLSVLEAHAARLTVKRLSSKTDRDVLDRPYWLERAEYFLPKLINEIDALTADLVQAQRDRDEARELHKGLLVNLGDIAMHPETTDAVKALIDSVLVEQAQTETSE